MKFLVLVISFLIFVGCKGGETTPSIENSKLTNKHNSYGYYGKDVLFGEYRVSKNWKLCGGENHETCFNLNFKDDGTIIIGDGPLLIDESKPTNDDNRNYGVSENGNIITFDYYDKHTAKFIIKGITGDTNHFTTNGGKDVTYKCYNVEFLDAKNSTMVDMCPWGWHAL